MLHQIGPKLDDLLILHQSSLVRTAVLALHSWQRRRHTRTGSTVTVALPWRWHFPTTYRAVRSEWPYHHSRVLQQSHLVQMVDELLDRYSNPGNDLAVLGSDLRQTDEAQPPRVLRHRYE